MNSTVHPINQAALINLSKADKVAPIYAVGQKAGWHVMIKQEQASLVLAHEEGLQIFSTLSALEDYLRGLGITSFLTDVSGLDRNAKDRKTQERFGEAKKAEEYDRWFRQQVEEALNDPRSSIPHSEVEEKFAARRAALLKKLAKA
ncbi:antitoxin PaaA2 family protein [Duganella radicis]|uniref:Stability determinant domain-containing protein n=1 Tax=Duganella radicis TaxID=551988 RepID=A0A6L6PSK7_9BURK|nr:hypothetical protein [Duganella radicis]MTV41215.1 hypothetical protein [Duganella radicis]